MLWLVILCTLAVAGSRALATVAAASEEDTRPRLSCEDARLKCAYRDGCGMALQNYIVGCSTVLQGAGRLDYCPEMCQYSLIALTSTEEGKDLMNCECNDDYCREAKQRVEICRPEVSRIVDGPDETVVSCRVAQWICAADTYCSAALSYYNRLCKSMFHGKKCTHRCLNSIDVLRRREKAAKLKTCVCDGHEDYDCLVIQRNMDTLCFNKHENEDNDLPNELHPMESKTFTAGRNAQVRYSSSLSTIIPVVIVLNIVWIYLKNT